MFIYDLEYMVTSSGQYASEIAQLCMHIHKHFEMFSSLGVLGTK